MMSLVVGDEAAVAFRMIERRQTIPARNADKTDLCLHVNSLI
jgi:hypothetical protein